MIDNLSEWYRIISIKPDDDTITKRRVAREAFQHLLFDEELDGDLIIASCSVAVCGFVGFPSEERLYTALLTALSDAQPSFPQQKSENALELQILAASAIDNLLRLEDAENDLLDAAKLLAASALTSAAHFRKRPKERRIALMQEGLLSAATSLLRESAIATRRRELIDVDPARTFSASDPAVLAEELLPWLLSVVDHLNSQAKLDRDEIEMLWFTISGFSKLANMRFADLPVAMAAAYCALEITDTAVFPVLDSSESLINKVIAIDRKPNAMKSRMLSEHIADWDDKTWKRLASQVKDEFLLAKNFPTVLPLTWLIIRNSESGGKMDWQTEFFTQTRIQADFTFSPTMLAKQLMNELTVIHFYGVDESEEE